MQQTSFTLSHLGKGQEYHERFEKIPYRRLGWEWEKRVLRKIVRAHARRNAYLDFACGTGRVLHELEGSFARAYGVDVAASMLEAARRVVTRAELIEADLVSTRRFEDETFDLITTFRFFANAEDVLRADAMRVLAGLLAPGGYLVFNNHKHTGSLTNRLRRLEHRVRGKRLAIRTMSSAEARKLIFDNGLELVAVHGWGVLPGTDNRLIAPDRVYGALEKAIARARVLTPLAMNAIYVCRKP